MENQTLKDALFSAMTGKENKLCKIGSIIKSLDSDTADALIAAMASDATTVSISRALAAHGSSVGRDVVGAKRDCFKNCSSQCCIRETIDTCLEKLS
jgi:hypothetical protein